MRFLSFLLAIFIGLSAQVVAATAPKAPRWHCQISASMRGDIDHFWKYGQDSWKGVGTMVCEGGGPSTFRNVTVDYHSYFEGFGADSNASLDVQIDLWTSMLPRDFQTRHQVWDRDNGPSVKWTISSALTEGRVFVSAFRPDIAHSSIQRGYLVIRPRSE